MGELISRYKEMRGVTSEVQGIELARKEGWTDERIVFYAKHLVNYYQSHADTLMAVAKELNCKARSRADAIMKKEPVPEREYFPDDFRKGGTTIESLLRKYE